MGIWTQKGGWWSKTPGGGGGGEDPPELIGAFDCSLDRGERDEPSGDVCGHISCVP